MTTLFPYAPPSANEFVIAWLVPLTGDPLSVGMRRPTGAVLPYRLVNRVASKDDKVTDSSSVAVHTFAATLEAAETAANLTHRRMLALAPPWADQQLVTISSGTVQADRVETSQGPLWLEYEDTTIWRFFARYEVDLRFVATP